MQQFARCNKGLLDVWGLVKEQTWMSHEVQLTRGGITPVLYSHYKDWFTLQHQISLLDTIAETLDGCVFIVRPLPQFNYVYVPQSNCLKAKGAVEMIDKDDEWAPSLWGRSSLWGRQAMFQGFRCSQQISRHLGFLATFLLLKTDQSLIR